MTDNISGPITGTHTELRFRLECLSRNIIPCIPEVNACPFDAITAYQKAIWRVQIKRSAAKLSRQGYHVVGVKRGIGYKGQILEGVAKRDRPYTQDEVDFIAIDLVEKNRWYIIPVTELSDITSLSIPTADKITHWTTNYIEAWHLLQSESYPSVKAKPKKKRRSLAGVCVSGQQVNDTCIGEENAERFRVGTCSQG